MGTARRREATSDMKTTDIREIERFTLNERIQHVVLFASLIVLAVTGLALRYHGTWFGAFLIRIEGGVQARGWIHRAAAIVLMALSVYHALYVIFTERGHGELMRIAPRVRDLGDFAAALLWSLGLSTRAPRYDKFGLVEKTQYWGAILGSLIMIVTGLALWFSTQSMAILPKWAVDSIAIVHGSEGLLIFLVLFLWHMYIVHLNPRHFPMSRTWITGRIPIERLREEHPLEYERVAGPSPAPAPGGKR